MLESPGPDAAEAGCGPVSATTGLRVCIDAAPENAAPNPNYNVDAAPLEEQAPAAGPITAFDAPLPDLCNDSVDGWAMTRTEACRLDLRFLSLWNDRGQIVAQTTYWETSYLKTSVSNGSWTFIVELKPGFQDPIFAGTEVVPSYSEDGGCPVDDFSFPRQLFFQGDTIAPWGEMTVRNEAFVGGISHCQGQFDYFFEIPAASTPSTPTFARSEDVRCDQDLKGSTTRGCVVPAFTPTLTYSRADLPEFTNHLSNALGSGLPGSPSNGPLHRMYDDTLINRNRNTATQMCQQAVQAGGNPPVGYECDEYPFAATEEGASTGVLGRPRSFDGCYLPSLVNGVVDDGGYSVCYISGGEGGDNPTEGGIRSSFWTANRVLDGDAFYVAVK